MATTATRFLLVDWLERRSRRQRQLVGAVVALYLVWRLGDNAAQVVLDRWWFETVTDAPVWSTRFWAQVQLVVVALAVAAVVVGTTVWHVLRLARDRQGDELTRFWQRYHERVGPGHRWLLIGLAALVAFRAASGAAGAWQSWLLFRHGGDLGIETPGLGTDLGEHLFRLPFLMGVSAFARQLILASAVIAAFGHAASGALRLPGGGRRNVRLAQVHLAVLVVLFAIAQALDYVFVRKLMLGTNRIGAFDGPGFTELRVVRPLLTVAALLTLAVGFAAVHFCRSKSRRPLVVAISAAAVFHLVGLVAVPQLVEKFIVAPAEAARQLDSIEYNLLATRTAFGLDNVGFERRVLGDGLTAELTGVELDAVERIPLFEQSQMATSFQVMAGTTGTRMSDVDLDRYTIEGNRGAVLISARSASRADLPERGWVQEHLVYTHGDGVVVAPADTVDRDGRPDVAALEDAIDPADGSLYFGEGLANWYVLVDTKRAEQGGDAFPADTGIPMGSMFRRGILALATGEPQPLLSAELTDNTQLLYRRDVVERVHALAPFLKLDADPYPVVVDDHVVWLIDGYTTSKTYPYAQFTNAPGVPGRSDLVGSELNYVHASAKVAVDAIDGTTTIYRTEVGGENDPILDVWDSIFPGLIRPIDEMDPALREHLRYPKDLFTIQTDLLGRYHVDDAETLFNGSQRRSISPAPPANVGDTVSRPALPTNLFASSEDSHWVVVRPYGPGASTNPNSRRDLLAAIAIGDNDDPEQLTYVEIESPSDRVVSSPQVAQSAIDADPELAADITLLNANGSKIQFGPMTPVVTETGVAWIRPLTVTGTGAAAAPRLYGVVAVSNGLVGFGPDVVSALDATMPGVEREP